ncbi:MAG: cytochrome b6 [Nitrospirae bacterium]|nr:MAG: cytochrome b6 [Nitrospirota bacterium]
MGRVFDWIDRTFRVKEPHRGFLKRRLPEGVSYLYCLGGVAFVCILTAVATGLLLSVYYVPSEKEAFQSVVRITTEVRFGWFVRSLHRWSAHGLIITMLLHTLRVIIQRAYRPPRELNWVAGVVLLVVVFGSGFTGYLLPWDQKAYWATEVGTSMVGTIPLIGKHLLYIVRGGPDITGETLIRFYAVHVLWFPLIMAGLLWAHFHMVKRQGISGGL